MSSATTGSAFVQIVDVGEVHINSRTSYRLSLIEHTTAHRRRFIEIRVYEQGQATRWAFRVDPRMVPELVTLLDLGKRMSEEIP